MNTKTQETGSGVKYNSVGHRFVDAIHDFENCEGCNKEEKVFAEYFATIYDGKIMVLGDAVPPHELVSCQIVLSKEEFDLLKAVRSDLDKAEKIIQSVRAKIKANGS